MILAARIKREFSFYVAPVKINDAASGYALITAVFDSGTSPLVIISPLIRDQIFTFDLLELFQVDTFNVYFFDLNDRELLSCVARVVANPLKNTIRNEELSELEDEKSLLDGAMSWFSCTGKSEDERATRVQLVENLFRDDFVIVDATSVTHGVFGSKSVTVSALVREEPGQYQEHDIMLAFQRTFSPHQIYLNPIKRIDGEEFVDILIVGRRAALLIQAKDSPNTEKTTDTSLDRKRRKSVSQLKEGAGQLKGAISFVRHDSKLRFVSGNKDVVVDVTGLPLIAIVVVRELFNDMYTDYSTIVFDFIQRTQTNMVFFDFPEFSRMTSYCKDEDMFLDAVMQILHTAQEREEFPRLRYSGKPE